MYPAKKIGQWSDGFNLGNEFQSRAAFSIALIAKQRISQDCMLLLWLVNGCNNSNNENVSFSKFAGQAPFEWMQLPRLIFCIKPNT